MGFIEKVYEGNLNGEAVTALIDAVFAVAMTILVLDIKRPESVAALYVPGAYSTYVNSLSLQVFMFLFVFFVLGDIWIGQRHMLNDIKETDRTFLWLSIFLLMGVTLVPLFYSLVTDFGKSFPFFTYIFDINFLVIGIFHCLQFYYASKKGFFGEVKHLRAKLTNIAFFPLTAFIALILSFGFPVESNIVYMIIPLSKKIYLHVYDKFDSGDDLLN